MNDNKSHSILIVDDEVCNIDLLYQILGPLYNVRIAKNGISALRITEKYHPDLILLDVIMPGMSGFEVLSQLKQTDSTKNIPVIFITGLDSIQDEERGLFLGAVDYITKPFHNSIVRLRVKTHLKILDQIRTIERLGMIDALTNIPNRRSFDHQLNVEWNRAIREKTPLSVLMLDIDKFKDFNDTYGHAHGDEALKTVAQVISQAMKRPTDFAARWGGEEFAVLLPGTKLKGAMEVAERIRSTLEQTPIPHEGTPTKITISIGVHAEIPETIKMIESFTSIADKALYEAKRSGRNTVKCLSSS